MQVDTFGAYVRAELEHWGREYALHRDCDYLGHHSKNLLAVLIEHKGDMPGRAQGYKPLDSDSRAQKIEDMVGIIARSNGGMACALRAYYCGRGRKKVECFETCLMLTANLGERPFHVKAYLDAVRRGEERIHGLLMGLALAA